MSLSLQDWRDVIIIAAGSLAILVLLAILIFTIVLGVIARGLLGTIQTVLKDELTPLLESGRQTLQKVQGTATFVGETTVAPIIRVYSVVAGARRMIGVLGGFAGRRNRQR